jgi:hypothetical protein
MASAGNSNGPVPRLLAHAAQAGDAQLVARLLGEGRDVNEADEFGNTAPIFASKNGHVKVVRLLLARQDVEVNKSAADGATALMLASYKGHVEVVRLLLAHPDVDVNKADASGATALYIASQNGHVGGAAPGRAPGRRGQQDRAERGHGADARIVPGPSSPKGRGQARSGSSTRSPRPAPC